jgi:ribosome-associated toxin RatA of RatAB toxin-antitoxin module
MPQVESRITINAPLQIVWELAQDIERFPDIMPDLDAVKVLERQQLTDVTTRVVSEWHGRIKQFNRRMDWTEEDIWNSETHTCSFWLLKGDFNEYRGEWKFTDDNGATNVHLLVEYRFDIPLVGALMQKVVQKLMQDNANGMLHSLHEEAEKRASGGSAQAS